MLLDVANDLEAEAEEIEADARARNLVCPAEAAGPASAGHSEFDPMQARNSA